MYGFPLTIYLLSGWLQTRYPETNIFSHDAGHSWNTLFGWNNNPHMDPFHLLSHLVIFCGFALLFLALKNYLSNKRPSAPELLDQAYARRELTRD